jgi:hypothetical protein
MNWHDFLTGLLFGFIAGFVSGAIAMARDMYRRGWRRRQADESLSTPENVQRSRRGL